MVVYGTRAKCQGCGRAIREELYLEKEATPDVYVAICEHCEPSWAILRQMEQKRLLRTVPNVGIMVSPYLQHHRRLRRL